MCPDTFWYFVSFSFLVFGNSSYAEVNSEEIYAEFTMEERIVDCPSWEDGIPTYLPFPYDCRKFVVCTNGYPIVYDCPPFTVWDQDLLTCNHEGITPCVIVTTESPIEWTSPETEEPTTTEQTTTTPTTTTQTTTTPTTTTPTTTTPTTTTPTTTTPTTTTPTTTTPTTTTPTTTTPTTTTPTTTTPTTTTSTTTTPTTTTPTTTRPTTTTPTTTRPTTTTTRATTIPPPGPIVNGGLYTILNTATGMAVSVYKSILTNGNKIHAMRHVPDCWDLSQQFRPSQHYTDSFWKLDVVPGTQFYTIYQTMTQRSGNIRYTGVANDIGIELDLVTPNNSVSAQRWGFVRCPA
ncbi:hypothetical protein Fcan01_17085 [Folsomia candida]|uniref:Chitin-binding type-2 domain-containing protein n=1 Tax=Folsomia candida TaxID=158441 RepID=A0A226DQK1_FOLCA|nr:hypothetical protein Fcan01_17085 [Folsomia candida]